MKQTIRLTEGDIQHMIMEALNEMSPEFLAHCERKTKNRAQAERFRRAASDALNRDYGFNKVPNSADPYETSLYATNEFTNSPHHPHYSQALYVSRDGSLGDRTDKYHTEDFADRLRVAHRNKYYNGQAAVERMNQGLNPQGQPYSDEGLTNVDEAVHRTIKRYLR